MKNHPQIPDVRGFSSLKEAQHYAAPHGIWVTRNKKGEYEAGITGQSKSRHSSNMYDLYTSVEHLIGSALLASEEEK